MIIAGDISSPGEKYSRQLKNVFVSNPSVFAEKTFIGNLEGVICDDIKLSENTPVLFNHSSVMDALKAANTTAVGLANNHTLDLPEYFDETLETLRKNEIAFTGAGKSKPDAQQAVVVKDGEKEVVLINACWSFLLYHQQNPTRDVHVAETDEPELVKEVMKYRAAMPDACIIVFLHWSFDLETLPFPMYRQFAKKLIDEGAASVIGAHSHCVQGGEKYKDGYIVYGLGNFFLPYNTFANGKLSFPDFSRMELAFELDTKTGKAACHWFEYQNSNDEHHLKLVASEDFENSALLKKHTPYDGMSDEAYISYYKKNRRKKFLVPVYKDYRSVFVNSLYTGFLKNRGRFARMLAKMKIRKWQN